MDRVRQTAASFSMVDNDALRFPANHFNLPPNAGRGRISQMNMMQDQDLAEVRVRLARLELEHEDLDRAIDAMTAQSVDQLCIQRFKKKKLALKDEITKLRGRTIPDIIA